MNKLSNGFFSEKIIPENAKVIACTGGGGYFGKNFIAKMPSTFYFLNIDNKNMIAHNRVINIPFCVGNDIEPLLSKLIKVTSRVDAIILAAYDTSFADADKQEDSIQKNLKVDAGGNYAIAEALVENFSNERANITVYVLSTDLLDKIENAQDVPNYLTGYLYAKQLLETQITELTKTGICRCIVLRSPSFYKKDSFTSMVDEIIQSIKNTDYTKI